MRASGVLRQLLAATLCAVLALPACSSAASLSSSTPSHIYYAETLSETRVWGSNEKILLHFRAVLLLSEKQHWGYEKCRWENVVGSGVTYDYDAFGNLIHSTGTTPNNYLFAGEQFDPDLHLYYNRARYLNTSTGRFWTMDPFEGDFQDPMSLHKYLYGSANPVSRIDPSGNVGLEDLLVGVAVALVVFSLTGCQKPGILKPPQKPTFRADGPRLVQDPQTGLQEVIRVDAAGPDAQDNYLVVQWVKGSQKVNGVAGLTVNQDQEVPNDFSSYRIDVPSSAKAEYPTLVKTSTEVSLFDTPGITSHGHFPSGMALAVDQDFKITVYDLHKYPANTPVSAFSDPWSPAPLDTFDWSFHASYTVP